MNLKKLIGARLVIRWTAGLAVFILAIVLSGPADVLYATGKGLKAFGTVFGLSAASLVFRAAAWKTALAFEGRKNAPFASVLKALTAVGGTPVRLAALKKMTGIADGAGSVVADEAVRSLAGMVFAGISLFLGFLFAPGNMVMRGMMLIAAVGGFGYVVIFSKRTRKGLFASCLAGLPDRLAPPSLRGKLEERDRFLTRFRARNRSGFYASFVIHLVGFLFVSLEILAVGKSIDAYFPGALSLGLAALAMILRVCFSSLPAAFGVLEAGVASVLALTFGAPLAAVGVAVVLVLRIVTVAWSAIGFAAAGNPVKLLFGK